jgi:glycosyltransferase involved in cell wall biosynthesis
LQKNKIRVLLINRKKTKTTFSIESVFNDLVLSLRERVDFFQVNGFSILKLIFSRYDIYHITGDVTYLGLFTPRKKTIITVHDIGHYESTLSGFKKYIYGLIWFRLPFFKIKNITTVSEFTKFRIVEAFGVEASNIHVIYNSLSKFIPFNVKRRSKSCPVILQIGSGRNKNRLNLIEAVKNIECQLIFIGKLSQEALRLLEEYNINYIEKSGLMFSEVIDCYIDSDIVYFASYYEGFGLPIIEAQKIGRPIIVGDNSSMPEIAGKNYHTVDASSVDQIHCQIKSLLFDFNYYNSFVEEGFKNIIRFDEKNTIMKYLDLYERIAKSK